LSAIYETGGPRTASRLTVGLSHPSWDVRRHAAALVGAFGGDDARAALTARLSIEEDDLVRDALSGALEEMDA
jgi:hypothetical protein